MARQVAVLPSVLLLLAACAGAPVRDVGPGAQPDASVSVSDLRNELYFSFRSPMACRLHVGLPGACVERPPGWQPEACGEDPDSPSCRGWRSLSERLETLAGEHPEDAHVIGQAVFAFTRDGQFERARRLAESCRADAWWCAMLRGHVAWYEGDLTRAEPILDSAYLSLPEPQLCDWTDLSWILASDALEPWSSEDCVERRRMLESFWWLVDPAWSRPGNEAKTEWLGRMSWTELHDDHAEESERWGGRVTDGRGHTRSHHEDVLLGRRHETGLTVAWRREWLVGPVVTPLPRPRDLRSPLSPGPEAWDLAAGPDAFRVETSGGVIEETSATVSIFERGPDSILAVAAVEPAPPGMRSIGPIRGWTLHAGTLRSGEVAVVGREQTGPGAPLSVLLSNDSWILGVEVSGERGTARWRAGHDRSGPRATGIRISDLLPYFPSADGAGTQDLPAALERIRGRTDWPRTDPFGVYFEVYGTENLDAVDLDVRVVPVERRGLLHRMAESIGLVDPPATLEVAWSQPAGETRVESSLALDISGFEPGDYMLRVRAGGSAMATRKITIRP